MFKSPTRTWLQPAAHVPGCATTIQVTNTVISLTDKRSAQLAVILIHLYRCVWLALPDPNPGCFLEKKQVTAAAATQRLSSLHRGVLTPP
jgi:hypothetical protein